MTNKSRKKINGIKTANSELECKIYTRTAFMRSAGMENYGQHETTMERSTETKLLTGNRAAYYRNTVLLQILQQMEPAL